MTNSERKELIKDLNEAINTYQFMLEDAILVNDTSEIKFLREQIQKAKREKNALKAKKEFKPHPNEALVINMFGDECPGYAANLYSKEKAIA